MESEGNTGMAIFIALIIFACGIGGAFYYFFYREGKNPFTVNKSIKYSTTSKNGDGGGSRVPGDINDNGIIDNTDVQIVRDHMGCKKNDLCWGDVIGKTLSGDNPIYTSDLDLNQDGIVDEQDAQVVLGKFTH
jgi:hypothetical protein